MYAIRSYYEIDVLKHSAQSRQAESENSQAQVETLQNEIADLKARIANMDQSNLIRWLTSYNFV